MLTKALQAQRDATDRVRPKDPCSRPDLQYKHAGLGDTRSSPVEGPLSKGPGQGCALCALIPQSVQGQRGPATQALPILLDLNWLRGACVTPMLLERPGNVLRKPSSSFMQPDVHAVQHTCMSSQAKAAMQPGVHSAEALVA